MIVRVFGTKTSIPLPAAPVDLSWADLPETVPIDIHWWQSDSAQADVTSKA